MSHVPFFTFLDTNGDGTGVKNAIGDYSGGAVDFKYIRPIGEAGKCFVNGLTVHLHMTAQFSPDVYGDNMTGKLINGLRFLIKDENGNIDRDLTDGLPIKMNAHWSRFGAIHGTEEGVGGDKFFKVSLGTSREARTLSLAPKWSFVAELNDDFSGLLGHTFLLRGIFI